jgi:hypothetical protein
VTESEVWHSVKELAVSPSGRESGVSHWRHSESLDKEIVASSHGMGFEVLRQRDTEVDLAVSHFGKTFAGGSEA